MSHFSVATLSENLRSLGIKEGDTVLVRGDIRKLGRVEGGAAEALFKSFFDVIGENGTLVGLTFTEQFLIYTADKNYIFDKNTPSKSGALAKIMLAHPNVFRSEHPVNSFAAIGKYASEIVAGHDENAHGYLPMEKLLELDAKMIIFGCVSNSPGFTTVHLAQEKLGLAYQTPFKNMFGVYFLKNGEKKFFKRKSIGGCSMGFYKFYADYAKHEKLSAGYYGNAYALAISARDAYAVEVELLKQNPCYALCDNPNCELCRGMWYYNWRQIPGFYLRNSLRVIKKVLKR